MSYACEVVGTMTEASIILTSASDILKSLSRARALKVCRLLCEERTTYKLHHNQNNCTIYQNCTIYSRTNCVSLCHNIDKESVKRWVWLKLCTCFRDLLQIFAVAQLERIRSAAYGLHTILSVLLFYSIWLSLYVIIVLYSIYEWKII